MNAVNNTSDEFIPPRLLVIDAQPLSWEKADAFLGGECQVVRAELPQQALAAMKSSHFEVVLADPGLPGGNGGGLVSELMHRYPESRFILLNASDSLGSPEALKDCDVLQKPFTESELRRILRRYLDIEQPGSRQSGRRLGGIHGMEDVLTRDPQMRKVCRLAEAVAPTDATVLISGETGTGKGLLAQAIHSLSRRVQGPFTTVDCGAIPTNLIESELFGHERGAFTGAVARKSGRVELARGGTLLLDEIGEMPLDMQVKLLRFLQSFDFERVGGTKVLHADVRVVAASNRNLWEAVREGGFRQDLFYRLHVINLHLPPLRERVTDIEYLAGIFLERYSDKYRIPVYGMSPEAKKQLLDHDWPGNVRELEHTVERAVILCRTGYVSYFDLARNHPGWSSGQALDERPPAPSALDMETTLSGYISECERNYLEEQLKRHEGRIGDTARAAGINPKTLYLKMNRYGLQRHDFKPGGGKRQN